MKYEKYKRIRDSIVTATAILMAFAVVQNSIFTALAAVTFGIVTLYLLRRGLTEVVHDERTILIQSKAASATLAIITVSIAIIGLSLIFVSGRGIGNYEQAGYLLAFQANIIIALRVLLNYYYRQKLGG